MIKKEFEKKNFWKNEDLKKKQKLKKMEAEQEELETIKKMHTTSQIYKEIIEQIEKLNIDSVMKGDLIPWR